MSLLRGVSFDHLKKTTKKFPLRGCHVRCEQPVVLELRYLGDDPKWENARLKVEAAFVTPPTPRQRFDAMLPAFAEMGVVGWEHVLDEDGQPAKATRENVSEVLAAYGEHALDLALATIFLALNADNFRETSPPKVDADALGK